MMWTYISNFADVLSVISAIITVKSAIEIKKYYKKIVRQYSIEKITVAEQKIHETKQLYQQIKKLYLSEGRGVTRTKLSELYIKIEENLDKISYDIPTSFEDLLSSIKSAKKQINYAMEGEKILTKSSAFMELGNLLDNINEGLKAEKEEMQKQNMQ